MNASRPFIALTCLSLLLSATTLILGALVLDVTPAMWSIPGAFITTFIYHTLITLLSRLESTHSMRWLSMSTVGGAYTLTVVWGAVLAITVVFTTLISIRKFDLPPNYPHHQRLQPVLISTCTILLVQSITMASIAFLSHKERRRAQYQAKWQWKITLNTSKWSINKVPGSL